MRFLQNLMLILLLATGVSVFAQERTEDADNARALEVVKSLMETGDFSDSQDLVDRMLEGLSQEFGPNHPILLQALAHLGQVFYQLGDYDGASRLFERRVELSTRILGPEHPDTLIAVGNCAVILRDQGDTAGARQRFEQVVEGLTQRLGA